MTIRPKDPRLSPDMADRVQKAREAWNNRRVVPQTRVLVSFDELLDSFVTDCMYFTDIGIGLGVTRERVRQLWNKHFRSLFRTEKTGHQRRRACTIARRRETVRNLTPTGSALVVAELADRYGLSANPIVVKRSGLPRASSKRLRIGNYTIYIKRGRKPRQYNVASEVRYYATHNHAPRACTHVVVLCGDKDVTPFIFPRADFLSWNGRKGEFRYIPDHRTDYHNSIEWVWKYENAWHLLMD